MGRGMEGEAKDRKKKLPRWSSDRDEARRGHRRRRIRQGVKTDKGIEAEDEDHQSRKFNNRGGEQTGDRH